MAKEIDLVGWILKLKTTKINRMHDKENVTNCRYNSFSQTKLAKQNWDFCKMIVKSGLRKLLKN